MKCLLCWCIALSIPLFTGVFAQKPDQSADLKLWYKQPASIWEEALPLGNGKTGAMVFGRVKRERYQLNDNTLWSGYPDPGNNPAGPDILPQIRQAVFAGDYNKASDLWKKMQGPYSARYLPLGDLTLDFPGNDSTTTQYYRDLDLSTAVATVRYTLGKVTYQRESFISHPDRVMVVRLTASKKAAINFNARLSSKLRFTAQPAGNELILSGKAPKFVANRPSEPQQVVYADSPQGEGMNFEIRLHVKTEGGTVKAVNDELVVSNANAVTLYLTEATSFNGFNQSPGLAGKNPSLEAKANLQRVLTKSYAQLKTAHIASHQTLFNRVNFTLDGDTELTELPTDERLIRQEAGKPDNQLQTLYYQFGRYLLIASSRPDSTGKAAIPANLQGIWNDHVQPPWGSNYTTNINTEMNYWLAENTNLSECHQPLLNFIGNLAINGAETAKVNYGINEGWCVHHNSDVWAKTSPPGGYEWDPRSQSRWSCWPMAGAWLSTPLWEHYRFTGNKTFLREKAYPLLKGAAQFMLSWLVEDGKGNLVTNPSTSPENTMKVAGKEYQVSMATTMDMAIIRELFNNCIEAATILETDTRFLTLLQETKARLYPYHIGQFGQLQEWFKDYDDPKDAHRHLSHLFGLHPGHQISPRLTPELAAAAKQSMIHRGDVSTGWSMAWKINWWARLEDGNHAYKILLDGLKYVGPKTAKKGADITAVSTTTGGGTYPNLFDAHPPFQIDGNFGGTAGMTEMLLQSHAGEISLLPALPDSWANGAIRGIKARGAFEVAMHWEKGRLTEATILANQGGLCRIRTKTPVKVLEGNAKPASGDNPNALTREPEAPPFERNETAKLVDVPLTQGYVMDLMTEKGKKYTLVPQ
ncbi:glycoside hydrolase family 95 protein [Tellurirhabdus bombi]|uniref:glycoside hydrolase family 95 protein n=1 Tax=Tellurirhabdus bombi TaxID=2907205 RepID=UPI001F23B5AC|nr:glycoside hydrolase family 95 protein [Tellurirhabdus bombi]